MNPQNIHCLSNITELTEENEPQGTTLINQRPPCIGEEDGKINQMDSIKEEEHQNHGHVFGRICGTFSKGLHCVEFACRQFYKKVVSSEINIEESQISEILDKMRKKKTKRISLLPELEPENEHLRTLVLDLEETLVFSTFKKPEKFDFSVMVEMRGIEKQLYVTKRFGVDSFLFQMSQMYEIVIFSSLRADAAEKIIEKLDPKKYVKHILTREHCIVINKSYYIKSVRDLGRNPKRVIVVDVNSFFIETQTISASLNMENLYKIEAFKGSERDRKLVKLGYFLKHIFESKEIRDVVPLELLRRQFEYKEIKIVDKNVNGPRQSKKFNSFQKKKQEKSESLNSTQEQETETRIIMPKSPM